MSVVEPPICTAISITTQTTTVCKTGAGVLERLIIPTPVASATVKCYDNTAGSGVILLDTITLPASPTVLPTVIQLGVNFTTGLTIVTGGATMSVTAVVR